MNKESQETLDKFGDYFKKLIYDMDLLREELKEAKRKADYEAKYG